MREIGRKEPESAAAQATAGELNQREDIPTDTPDMFLATVTADLKASPDVDADLASILADHVLTSSPHADAVKNAKNAIVALAAKRAAPPGDRTDG